MCGAAIIAEFIPTRSRRLTADYLWPDLKKSGSIKESGRRYSNPVIDLDDDFEADFQEFKDEESDADDLDDVDVDDVLADVKHFAFSAAKKPASAASRVSSTDGAIGASQNPKPLSKDQIYRIRLKERELLKERGYREQIHSKM